MKRVAETSKSEKIRFFNEFLSNPKAIGAVAPSSIGLARKMADWLNWNEIKTVVEYGPGTGAITEIVLKRMRPSCRYVAVEQSSLMANALQKRFPELKVIVDRVENIVAICTREQLSPVDFIVSGLPWANFSEDQQESLLKSTLQVLAPGGHFATFAYFHGLSLPAGRRFRDRLKAHFPEVRRSRLVWKNMPPAFVYRCRVK